MLPFAVDYMILCYIWLKRTLYFQSLPYELKMPSLEIGMASASTAVIFLGTEVPPEMTISAQSSPQQPYQIGEQQRAGKKHSGYSNTSSRTLSAVYFFKKSVA